jgi:hypothetical protein
MKTRIFCLLLITGLLASQIYSYGSTGHRTVGAIADQRLANTPTAAKISTLLNGLTLARAATLPDEIKSWDKTPPTDPRAFHLKDHPIIEQQLIAFVQANPAFHQAGDNRPSHHDFHFTDVPVVDNNKYVDNKTGTSKFDIVHMIPFCIRVLTGEQSDTNDRKITKAIAVILLAHYLGDIHQPLHVGAEYFTAAGKTINPDKGGQGFPDEGGNTLFLTLLDLSDHGHASTHLELHGFWDNQAAATALQMARNDLLKDHPEHSPQVTDDEVIQWFARTEPAGWKLSQPVAVKDLAKAWADDILPFAVQAHERLDFSNIVIEKVHGVSTAKGFATERQMADHIAYKDFAGKVAEDEIHKAGWRLAALLEQVIK